MTKVLLLSTLAAILGLAGCFKRGPQTVQTPLSIFMSAENMTSGGGLGPGFGTLGLGQVAKITAIVYDQNSQGVQWSVSPLFGTLSNQTFDPSTLTATVTYTAPSAGSNTVNLTVTAASITDPNISASLSIPFVPNPLTISLQYGFFNLFAASVPASTPTLNPLDRLYLYATVGNDDAYNRGTCGAGSTSTQPCVTYTLSPATGAGSITVYESDVPQNVFYTAPTVSAPTTVTVTAAAKANPNLNTSLNITILPTGTGAGPNVVALDVNGGPVPGHVYPNRAFTSIVLCNPGSTVTCQTIDGILVDTGSVGLRILDSEIPLLNLPHFTDQAGNILENCGSWPDGSFLWGPVATADFYIGGLAATGGPRIQGGNSPAIQVISSKPAAVPDSCTNGATVSDNTPELLGANGILGIGPEPTDCVLSGVNYCDGSQQSTPNVYYSCPTSGCTTADSPVTVSAGQQVSNPVTLLPAGSYNNGVIIQFPAVSDPQASATGTMTFGVAIPGEPNTYLSKTATIFTLDANDNFSTIFNGQILTNSFIDSGSSGLLFPDDSLPSCTVNNKFYCPTSSPVTLSAKNVGQTQGQATINFTVEDADSLLSAYSQDSVFPTLAGPSQIHGPCPQASVLCVFDWGLPFFYGRTVYMHINVGDGPSYWAY